jgi:hypothetical protein
MVPLWLEEMNRAMELINSLTHTVCMSMMMKQFMSLIQIFTVLWNGNVVRRVGEWLSVEMDKEVDLISYIGQRM